MKHLLSSSAYLVVNKKLARQVGLKAVVLLADLISKENYFENRGYINYEMGGWFFNTSKNIEQDTTLTNYQQKKAIKKLVGLGFIETKLMGVPATLHFKILENNISSYFNTSFQETSKQDLKKLKTNKNKEIIITNKPLFIDEVFSFDYPKEILQEFYDYWSEPSKTGKLRKDMQKTWCTSRRLKTWVKRAKQFNTTSKGVSKIDQQLNSYEKAINIIKNNYDKEN